jgi:hypothetical protein
MRLYEEQCRAIFILQRDFMNRIDFQALSRVRLRESRILLKAGYHMGAYYLIGYSVECGLKACISKKTKRCDFPPSREAIQKIYTHDLQTLLNAADLVTDFNLYKIAHPDFAINWNIVKDWSEAARYDLLISPVQTRDLFSACTSRINGILPWIRTKW